MLGFSPAAARASAAFWWEAGPEFPVWRNLCEQAEEADAAAAAAAADEEEPNRTEAAATTRRLRCSASSPHITAASARSTSGTATGALLCHFPGFDLSYPTKRHR